MDKPDDYLQEHEDRFLAELLSFLRIPSISALPDHAADVARAADWVTERLTAAGLHNVEIWPTDGHPVVYADWLHAPGQPTVLIYGHFDTQPADPLPLWTTPPFEPRIQDGRIYARGASDDKGNMLIPILAIESLLQTDGVLPVNVKFFLEGQEEILSPQLPALVEHEKARLACDLVISADSGQWSEDEPSLTLGSRGACSLQLDVTGANSDLHSGTYGGAVTNPIHSLVQILNSMRSTDGRIMVEGFYDDVVNLSSDERTAIAAVPFDQTSMMNEIGVDALSGESGYTPYERMWARPTLEVNGIWGGFQGQGMKTVLPNVAHAKISCRLVPNQDPQKIVELVAAHARSHAPAGVSVAAQIFAARAKPYLMPADHWGNRAAADVLTEMYGRTPYRVRTGGSVPVNELFLTVLNAYTVGFGFGLKDEHIHAPNEFFRLSSFRRGPLAYVKLLRRLAA